MALQQQEELAGLFRFFKILRRYWLLIILIMGLGLTAAYLANRYAVAQYNVSGSLFIKSNDDTQNPVAELMNKSSLLVSEKSVYNELKLLSSTRFVERGLRQLDFQAQYIRPGQVKTSELYKNCPFKAQLDTAFRYKSDFSTESYVVYLNKKGFYHMGPLRSQEMPDIETLKQLPTHQYGQWVSPGQVRFKLKKKYLGNRSNIPRIFFLHIHPFQKIVRRFKGKIKAERLSENGTVIALNINLRNKYKGVKFINALMNEYLQHGLEQKNQRIKQTLDYIDEELGRLSDSLNTSEAALEQFQSENRFLETDVQLEKNLQSVASHQETLAKLKVEERYFDFLDNYLSGEFSRDSLQMIVPTYSKAKNSVLQKMTMQLVNMQVQKKTYLKEGGRKNPFLKDLNEQIKNTKKGIEKVLANERHANHLSQQKLRQQITQTQNRLKRIPSKKRQYLNIKRIYNLNEKIYLMLLERRAELGMSKASNLEDGEIVEPASQSTVVKTYPTPALNYALAFGVSGLFSIGLALALNLLTSRVQSEEELKNITQAPLYGVIGHQSSSSSQLAPLEAPSSMVADDLRNVRTNIEFHLGDSYQSQRGAVILLTSSISAEGKSFMAANLAASFASKEQRTLVICADMRKPELFLPLAESSENRGLSLYLSGNASIEESIIPSTYENLFIIPAGPLPPNPSELLERSRFKELVEAACKHYDIVLIDSTPMGILSEPRILMAHADLNLYVVRHRFTPLRFLRTLNENLQEGRIKQLGLIYNDKRGSVGRYGYSYSYYGYYQHSEDSSKASWWTKLLQTLSLRRS